MRRTGLNLIACALVCCGVQFQSPISAESTAARSPVNASSTLQAAPPMPAEYAVRWDVQKGGPRSAKSTLAALQRQPDDSDDFEVQYFDVTPPSDTPPGFSSILRQRREGQKKHELTFKNRGDRALSSWTCPLSAKPDELKQEIDVSFLEDGQTKRVYSYSCTLESKDKPIQPPPALQARPRGCTSKMSRLKAGQLKVEEWHLPGNVVMVEVSRNGLDTPAELDSFQREVVAPLVTTGIQPSDRSKTELGSDCK